MTTKGGKTIWQVNSAGFEEFGGTEVSPGSASQSDEELLEFIRNKAETIYHPIGTCKMGADDDDHAVVDTQLRVKGIKGLRVVDASVMPSLIGGNTNAPTIMIAEKAADMIKQSYAEVVAGAIQTNAGSKAAQLEKTTAASSEKKDNEQAMA